MSEKKNEINYPALFQKHLRLMVKELLEIVAKEGLPGNNHFYITFRTDHPDALLSDSIKNKYPKEMMIVLQNQYKGLSIDETGFKISLAFSGLWDNMFIPFGAISQFVDPHANFLIPLEPDKYKITPSKPLTLISPQDDNKIKKDLSTDKNISELSEKNSKSAKKNSSLAPKEKLKKKNNLVFVDFTKKD